MEQLACSQNNVHKRFSPFEALIDTNAFFQIKAAYISFNGDMYELRAMIRVRSDFRWHWINDLFIDACDASQVVERMINLHTSNFKEHGEFLNAEGQRLKNTTDIDTQGFSFFYEELK